MTEPPICQRCGLKPCTSKGVKKNGEKNWAKLCWKCRRPELSVSGRYRSDRKFKLDKCECAKCGFKPEHPCQMDIDHKDGNKFNNEPSNRQLLCANCHRLKTLLNKDYTKKYNWS